ncbi:MAG: polyphosphate polymerase domain-containing protein, partial [Flavobacteriales bacterium]|nr:polyphosphate polymerase domain-containing protein [Flavobacteriales bacterium]
MENFTDSLDQFDPITLAEMDGVALMNRTDTKYVFGRDQLLKILEAVKDDYRILEIDGVRSSAYKTLYFDTPEMGFYRAHQNGKKNRYKVRSRKYVESDITFLEVKFKNNKGRTVKTRVNIDDFELDLSRESNDFIEQTSGTNFNLVPSLWNSFNRITLVNQELPERVTIDTQLAFEMGDEHVKMKNLVIAELKQENAN